MFLHNLSQRHISALSRAIFRLNNFFSEVNHTINKFMLSLLTRSRATCIKCIHFILINVIVDIKCYHTLKDVNEQGIINTEEEWGSGNFSV